MTEYPVPTRGSNSAWIAVGSDRNLWFTEQAGNKVARITTGGVVTEYPVPTPGSGPSGIASGPDGRLWFDELFGNQIGALRPSARLAD